MFTRQSLINGKYHWSDSNNSYAIWYGGSNFGWMFGLFEELGTLNSSQVLMHSEDSAACPDYVENWRNDHNATVTCGKNEALLYQKLKVVILYF